MSKAGAVARRVRLFADNALSPAALSANLARIAIQTRDDLISRGDAPPTWTTYVDGRKGAPEASVQPDGAIIYRFNVLGLAASFALAFCMTRSPVRSGRFRKSWAIAVDGKHWTGDLNDIPSGSEIMVVNPQPYARKVETGGMRMSVPPGIVDGARLAVRRQYPAVDAEVRYVTIPSGALPPAPWILRNRARSRRKDRAAGQPLTYPALIISERA